MYGVVLGFPVVTLLTHLASLTYTDFYPRFTTKEKHEWVGWVNTMTFQVYFVGNHLLGGYSPVDAAIAFFLYNLWDSLHILMYKPNKLIFFHHACVALGGYIGAYAYPETAMSFAHATAILESANILLCVSWLLNRAGQSRHLWAKGIAGASLVVYCTNRCLWFPWYILTGAPWIVTIALLPFIPMNLYWSWKLAGYYHHILTKGKRDEDASSTERCPEASSCSPDRSGGMPPLGCRPCTQLASQAESQ